MTKNGEHRASVDGGAYTIRIREHLDPRWSDWFEPMTLTTDHTSTLLVGYLPDQAALHRIIANVARLGLVLVGIEREDPATEH
jgi:hypothetical protein